MINIVLNDLKILLKEKGVVGAGGAGFPTYAKLSYEVNTVILNGAECEPLFRVDKNLLSENTYEVLKGLDIIVETVGAEKGVIAFKEHFDYVDSAVDYTMREFPRLTKKVLKDGYPAGDEVTLVYNTTGLVVPQGGIPIDVGVMVINVETAINVYNAVERDEPVIYKYVTVGGEVKEPATLRVPIGTSFGDLLNIVGGSTIKDYKLLVGGPMTGKIGTLKEAVTKTTKGIFILPPDNPVFELREYKLNIALKRAMGICSQCRMCTDLCPRYLLGHDIEPHKIMNSLAFGLDYNSKVFVSALACCECNLCSTYSCHQNLNPKAIISDLKNRLRVNGVKLEKKITTVNEEIDYRRVSVKRVIGRLKLSKYDVDSPISDLELTPTVVNISFRQSIGAASEAVVNKGDKIKKGHVIAVVPDTALGVFLHSPIDGTVEEINNNSIKIRKDE